MSACAFKHCWNLQHANNTFKVNISPRTLPARTCITYWAPFCSVTLLPAALHTFTVTVLYAPFFSIHIIHFKADGMNFVGTFTGDPESNVSLTYKHLVVILVHSPYSSAVLQMQNIHELQLRQWAWMKLSNFGPCFQPENMFFFSDLMEPNRNFHVYSFSFLSVFILYLLACTQLFHAKFSKYF